MRWMKIDEARQYAGGVSRKLMYRAVASGSLKAARVGAGRSLVFHDHWIDEWLSASVHKGACDPSVHEAQGLRASILEPAERPLRLIAKR